MQERSPAGPQRSGDPVRILDRQPEPAGAALSPDLAAGVRRLTRPPGAERGRSSPEAVLRLQREAGNRAVRRALGRAPAEENGVPPEVEDGIQRARGGGAPLDAALRARMEPAFGSDFSGVRIHTGAEADRLNQAVSARAFTTGRDIFFRQGEYAPGSSSGRELLAHELTHVVQQGGSGGAVQGKLTLGPADDAYEREADRTARAVVQREAASGSCCAGKKEEEHCAECRANAAIQRSIEEEQFPGEEVEQAAGDTLMRAPYGLQRSCRSAPCPAVAVPVDALFPLYEAAERCIQTLYAQDHPEAQRNVSLSFNLDWMYISGKGPQQKMALSCLRGLPGPGGPNYTAKGGMRGAEPDIWDFENRTIYEITTASGVGLRAGKVNWECELANRLCEPAECGGLTFRPGSWAPAGPCYQISGDLYLRVMNSGGVLIYQVLKDAAKETLTAVALAAAAAALKKSGGTGAGKAAGGKLVPAYAIASLVAAVILVSSGKAEAKAGPGDQEPLAQLFQALAEKGTTVPPEIQKMLEENPEIKEKVAKALAQGGDATAAQKALNEEILKIIADNKDQFTAEDLELILATTGMAGPALPKQDVTASSVQAMLDQIRSGQTYQPGQTGQLGQSGTGTPSKPPAAGAATSQTPGGDKPVTPAAPGAQPGDKTGDTPAAAPATPDSKMEPLAPGVKAKITGAPAPVKGLFDAMTAKTGSGIPLGNAEVERFFAAVPADLTEAESNALRTRLSEVQGHNLDQVLKGLEAALQELRKKRTQQTTTQSQGVMDESAEKAANNSSSDTETVGKLAQIAKGTQTPASQFRLTWSKEKGGRIHAVLTSRTADGVGLAAWVTAKVVRQDANTLEVEGLSSTPLVSATGQVVKPAGFFAGRKESLVRDKPKKK